ncbi:MAG: protein BatD [Bacteroidetes bacterium]|nr:protein BatD [Bacteroidota bacterium]
MITNRIPVILLALLATVFSFSSGFGQGVTVQLSAEQTTYRVNDLIQITIEVTAGSNLTLPKAEFSVPAGIKRMTGQSSTSQGISIVNGSYKITQSESHVLMATKQGTYTIGPAVVVVNGSKYQSNSVSLKILAAGEKSPAGSSGGSTVEDFVFLKGVPSVTNPVVGQPVYIRYKLYFRTRISNVNLVTDAAGTGVLSEDLNTGRPNQQPDQETVNGQQFSVVSVRKLLIYPQQDGTVTINPLVLTMQAARPRKTNRQSIFDDFLADPFQEYAQINVTSQPIKLTVKPIGSQPSDFSGMTGQLIGSRKISKTETDVNQPVSVTLTFEGVGNFKNFIPPKLEFGPNAESYPPKETVKVNPEPRGGSGKWTVEYVVIPRVSGELLIPAVSLSYYNLSAGKFEQITFEEKKIKVKGNTTAGAGSGEKYDFRSLGRDITFIQTTTTFQKVDSGRIELIVFAIIFVIIAWIGFFIFLFLKNRFAAERSDRLNYAHKNAEKFARKSFLHVRKVAETGDLKDVLSEIQKVFNKFIAHRAKLPETAWTVDEVLTVISRKQIPDEISASLRNYLTKLNEYRFAPIQMISESKEELILDAETNLTELSKYL